MKEIDIFGVSFYSTPKSAGMEIQGLDILPVPPGHPGTHHPEKEYFIPQRVFFQSLMSRLFHTVVHIGGNVFEREHLSLDALSAWDARRVGFSVHDGILWSDPNSGALLLRPDTRFWDEHASKVLLESDVAVYVTSTCADDSSFEEVLRKTNDSQAELALLDDATLCAFSVADGAWIRASWRSDREAEALSILNPALNAAREVVCQSPWYRQNAAKLVWSQEYACLVLPE